MHGNFTFSLAVNRGCSHAPKGVFAGLFLFHLLPVRDKAKSRQLQFISEFWRLQKRVFQLLK